MLNYFLIHLLNILIKINLINRIYFKVKGFHYFRIASFILKEKLQLFHLKNIISLKM